MSVDAFSSCVRHGGQSAGASRLCSSSRTTRASRPIATPPPAVATVAGHPRGHRERIRIRRHSAMPVPDTPSVGASYRQARGVSRSHRSRAVIHAEVGGGHSSCSCRPSSGVIPRRGSLRGGRGWGRGISPRVKAGHPSPKEGFLRVVASMSPSLQEGAVRAR